MKRLILLGAGGYGKTVKDLAQQLGIYSEILFLDDHSSEAVGSCSDFTKFQEEDTEMYPAFGNNEIRLQWIHTLIEAGITVPELIHPTAYVSPTVFVSAGCVVLPNAVVNTNSRLSMGCIVNCGAVVDHDCVLEPGVHVCLNAVVKAENILPSLLKVEAGSVIENKQYTKEFIHV